MTKVKYINYGIGCRIGNQIFLNKTLKNYPDLHDAILKHEQQHTSGFSLKDIALDLRNSHLKDKKMEYYAFIIENPSSWVEFLPFWWYESKFFINPLILGIYGLSAAIIGLIGWLLW